MVYSFSPDPHRGFFGDAYPNPPFNVATLIIEHAINRAKYEVIMLLRLTYLEPCKIVLNHAEKTQRLNKIITPSNHNSTVKIYALQKLTYQESLVSIDELSKTGIEAWITTGGVAISLLSQQIETAKCICKKHGASFSEGNTTHQIMIHAEWQENRDGDISTF